MLPEEKIISKIYLIRGKKVMLDNDLAELYGVETKSLKRSVRRNKERFPSDFMFELEKIELDNLRCKIGTSSWGGVRYAPMAFTEQGVAMLSSVLNSQQAIEVNIQIIRIFSRFREILLAHKDILIRLEKLEYQSTENNKEIQLIFRALKELLVNKEQPRKKIGYKINKQ